MIDPVLEWRGLRHRYARGTELAFDDLTLAPGRHLLLRGASGTGKSTLLALLAGLLTPSAGAIALAGRPLQDLTPRERDVWRGATLGFVPQRLHLSAALSVADNLALPFVAAGLAPDTARAAALLERLGIGALAARRPHELSVGQAQRVALARALMRRPRLLLADEPSAALDDANAAALMELLLEAAAEQGATLVIATHDGRLADALGTRTDVLEVRLA